jgi:hypothetical protein
VEEVAALFLILEWRLLAVLVAVLEKHLVQVVEQPDKVLLVEIARVSQMLQVVVAVLVLLVVTEFLTVVDLVALEHLILFPEHR